MLGPLVVGLFCFIMDCTKDWVLEAMAHAEALSQAGAILGRRQRGGGGLVAPAASDYLVATARKFEVTDLFALFLGARARLAYVLTLAGYMYGALWAYTSVFASSFATNVPLPGDSDATSFQVWWLVFVGLAVPFACMDLTEQVALQYVMFGARVAVVLLMSLSVLAGFGCDGVVFSDDPANAPPAGSPLAAPGGLATLVPVAIYAFIFHHSVPILAQPVGDKKSLNRVFQTAFLITGAFYVSIGLLLALSFGDRVDSQCNLNWGKYVGCVPRTPVPAGWYSA